MTRSDLSFVVGCSPVVDCTFASQAGGFRLDYQALLPEQGSVGDVERADRIVASGRATAPIRITAFAHTHDRIDLAAR